MSTTLATRPGKRNTAGNQCKNGFVWKKKACNVCQQMLATQISPNFRRKKDLKWSSDVTKLEFRKMVPHQCAMWCGFTTDLTNREQPSFHFNMLLKGTHLQLCSMYKVKRAVLHHRGYNTGFISARMENISKVEKGTIVFKAVSFISFKFIANIMDECLFWRSKVTQTTCFLNKMSSRAKHKTSPILPNNHTSDNPTSTKAPWLRKTSGWGCFETPPCAQSCCSCNPDVGDIINLCATTLKGKNL